MINTIKKTPQTIKGDEEREREEKEERERERKRAENYQAYVEWCVSSTYRIGRGARSCC